MSRKEAFKVEEENGKETCWGYGVQGLSEVSLHSRREKGRDQRQM